mgnify:CR=1 FL=1
MQIVIKSAFLVIMVLTSLGTHRAHAVLQELEQALNLAGENRTEIESALENVPDDQRFGLEWLVARMPERDLTTLDAEFLLTNTHHAYTAWRNSPWSDQISREVFLDAILPYASINERRDNWRADFSNNSNRIALWYF